MRESGQEQPPISLGGLSKLLHRLGISSKRGRRHVHSPDLLYHHKLRVSEAAQRLKRHDPRQ